MTQLDWKVRLREIFNPPNKRLSQLPRPSPPMADKDEPNAPTKAPSEPTGCRPGSWTKIEVMRQRYERGEHIHHDLDNRDALTEYEAKIETQNNPYHNGLHKVQECDQLAQSKIFNEAQRENHLAIAEAQSALFRSRFAGNARAWIETPRKSNHLTKPQTRRTT